MKGDEILRFQTFASSSSGNAAVITSGDTAILLDAGISAKRIVEGLRGLDIRPEDLSGILITHEHTDHIKGVRVLLKRTGACIFAVEPVAAYLEETIPEARGRIVPFAKGEELGLGAIGVRPFLTPHDSLGSVGYIFDHQGEKLTCLTDFGCITPEIEEAVRGAQTLFLEANHDVEMVRCGLYPGFLKRRILDPEGHISNGDSGRLAVLAAESGTRQIILGHLSRENNTPSTALQTVAGCLVEAGVSVGADLSLAAAPAECPGDVVQNLCKKNLLNRIDKT